MNMVLTYCILLFYVCDVSADSISEKLKAKWCRIHHVSARRLEMYVCVILYSHLIRRAVVSGHGQAEVAVLGF